MLHFLQHRSASPLMIGLALLIGVLVFKPVYLDFIDTSARLSRLEGEQSEKQKEYDALMKIKEPGASGSLDASKRAQIGKLARKWNTSDIMETIMLNDYTKITATTPARITLSAVTTDKGVKLPNGLSLGKVNIGIQAQSIEDIIQYVTYLTTTSRFAFTLDSISLPLDTAPETAEGNTGYGLALTLGIYHYE